MAGTDHDDYDEALNWCLEHNVEIDPGGSNTRSGVCLHYFHHDKINNRTIEVNKFAPTLQEAVKKMQEDIGHFPAVGIIKK